MSLTKLQHVERLNVNNNLLVAYAKARYVLPAN